MSTINTNVTCTSSLVSKYSLSVNGLKETNKDFDIPMETGIKNTTASVVAPITNIDADFEYTIDSGVRKMPNVGNIPFDDEIKFFNDNLAVFLTHETLTDQYVAIFNQQIIDKDSDKVKLMKRVYAREGYKPILFKKVSSEKRVLYVRSPKLR